MRTIAAATLLLLVSCEDMSKEDEQKFRLIVRSESIIKSSLKDPESVEFSQTMYVQKPPTVCGSFNAKNGFGGYTGFKRYVYNGSEMHVEGYTPNFDVKWVACVGARPSYEN